MRARAGGTAALVLVLTGAPAGWLSGEAAPDGRAVMEHVDARPRGGDQRASALWRLIDARGGERVRETRSYWRDYRGLAGGMRAKRLIVFDAPPEVRETGFLVWTPADPRADEERWIYLPALRKVRRVASGDRGKSFVGTDFSYEDLGERDVGEDEHVLLRVEPRGGADHYVVESTPRDADFPYGRRIQFVHAERLTPTRIEYFDRQGHLLKVLEAEWAQSDGVWAWRRLEMRDEKSGHRTAVELSEVRHGVGLRDDVFTESSLRLGLP